MQGRTVKELASIFGGVYDGKKFNNQRKQTNEETNKFILPTLRQIKKTPEPEKHPNEFEKEENVYKNYNPFGAPVDSEDDSGEESGNEAVIEYTADDLSPQYIGKLSNITFNGTNRVIISLNDLQKINQQLRGPNFAYNYIKQGKLENILESIQTYCDDVKFVCQALDAMIHCSKIGRDDIFAVFEEVGGCECTVQCMQQHPTNMDVQHKGLLILLTLSQHNDPQIAACLAQEFILKAAVTALKKAANDPTCTRSTAMIDTFCNFVFCLLDETVNENVAEKARQELVAGGVERVLSEILFVCPGHREVASTLQAINFGEPADCEEDALADEYSADDVLPEHMGKMSMSEESFSSFDDIAFIEEMNQMISHQHLASFGQVLNEHNVCEEAREYFHDKVGIADDEPAQKMTEYPPQTFINAIFMQELTAKQGICIYSMIQFISQQIVSENYKYDGAQREKWLNLNKTEIVHKISPSPPLSWSQIANQQRKGNGINIVGHNAYIANKTKLKRKKPKTIEIGVAVLGDAMCLEIKLKQQKERKCITLSDLGVISLDGEYIQSLSHNHNYIDRGTTIAINLCKTNRKSANVSFVHCKNGQIVSKSTVIALKFKKSAKSMKSVISINQMDGNGEYYIK